MLPHMHFIVAVFLALILYPLYGFNVIIIILFSVLMDVDHYLLYIIRNKSFNIKNAFNYFRYFFKDPKNIGKQNLCIFHTIEFLIITIILSFYSKIALLILYATLLHYALDYIHFKTHTKNQGFKLSIINIIYQKILRKKEFNFT